MSELKYCQGPSCHTYHTQDRLKGPKEIRLIKLEEDQAFIILVAMPVQ